MWERSATTPGALTISNRPSWKACQTVCVPAHGAYIGHERVDLEELQIAPISRSHCQRQLARTSERGWPMPPAAPRTTTLTMVVRVKDAEMAGYTTTLALTTTVPGYLALYSYCVAVGLCADISLHNTGRLAFSWECRVSRCARSSNCYSSCNNCRTRFDPRQTGSPMYSSSVAPSEAEPRGRRNRETAHRRVLAGAHSCRVSAGGESRARHLRERAAGSQTQRGVPAVIAGQRGGLSPRIDESQRGPRERAACVSGRARELLYEIRPDY